MEANVKKILIVNEYSILGYTAKEVYKWDF